VVKRRELDWCSLRGSAPEGLKDAGKESVEELLGEEDRVVVSGGDGFGGRWVRREMGWNLWLAWIFSVLKKFVSA
jgi:hypothetical protein